MPPNVQPSIVPAVTLATVAAQLASIAKLMEPIRIDPRWVRGQCALAAPSIEALQHFRSTVEGLNEQVARAIALPMTPLLQPIVMQRLRVDLVPSPSVDDLRHMRASVNAWLEQLAQGAAKHARFRDVWRLPAPVSSGEEYMDDLSEPERLRRLIGFDREDA